MRVRLQPVRDPRVVGDHRDVAGRAAQSGPRLRCERRERDRRVGGQRGGLGALHGRASATAHHLVEQRPAERPATTASVVEHLRDQDRFCGPGSMNRGIGPRIWPVQYDPTSSYRSNAVLMRGDASFAALEVAEHFSRPELGVGVVDPFRLDEDDPLVGIALADFLPRQALRGRMTDVDRFAHGAIVDAPSDKPTSLQPAAGCSPAVVRNWRATSTTIAKLWSGRGDSKLRRQPWQGFWAA